MVSQQMFYLFSRKIREFLRCVDRVTLKGSLIPVKLYAFDVNWDIIHKNQDRVGFRTSKCETDNLKIQLLIHEKKKMNLSNESSQKLEDIIKKIERLSEIRKIKKELELKNPPVIREFLRDEIINKSTQIFRGTFKETWKNGLRHYLDGI